MSTTRDAATLTSPGERSSADPAPARLGPGVVGLVALVPVLLIAAGAVPGPALPAVIGLGAVTGGLAWVWTWLTTAAGTGYVWYAALLSAVVATAAYASLLGLLVVLGSTAVGVLAVGTAVATATRLSASR